MPEKSRNRGTWWPVVPRGGSWNNDPQNARSAYRNRNTPENRNNNLGFRVAQAQRARWTPRRIEPIALRFRRRDVGQIVTFDRPVLVAPGEDSGRLSVTPRFPGPLIGPRDLTLARSGGSADRLRSELIVSRSEGKVMIRALPSARAATQAVGNMLAARAKELYRPLTAAEKRTTPIGVTRVRINGAWREVVSVNAQAPPEAVETLRRAVEQQAGIFRQAGGDYSHPDDFLHAEYASAEGFEAIGISHAGGPCPDCRSYFTQQGFGDVYWDSTLIR